jgi:hypothetical protein
MIVGSRAPSGLSLAISSACATIVIGGNGWVLVPPLLLVPILIGDKDKVVWLGMDIVLMSLNFKGNETGRSEI